MEENDGLSISESKWDIMRSVQKPMCWWKKPKKLERIDAGREVDWVY